jgi:hypothetical protein
VTAQRGREGGAELTMAAAAGGSRARAGVRGSGGGERLRLRWVGYQRRGGGGGGSVLYSFGSVSVWK